MLAIENLSKTYNGPEGAVRALVDVSVTAGSGEFVAVQGPSGCGKSTLLLAAGGLLMPEAGRITIDGHDLLAMPNEARTRFRAKTIGFVFQQFHLVPYLTVLDNVLAASLAVGRSDNGRDRARELIDHFGLADRVGHYPAELSTGERQRTALARALLNRPKLLLADEPTGNLDRQNADVVLGYLAEFARDGGAVLLVTHDPDAARYAQRAIHLKSGKLEPTSKTATNTVPSGRLTS